MPTDPLAVRFKRQRQGETDEKSNEALLYEKRVVEGPFISRYQENIADAWVN